MRTANAVRVSEVSRPRGESAGAPALFSLIVPWSPRQECRTDPAGEHKYFAAPLPDAPPSDPWALYLADDNGQYRILGFDFDQRADISAAHVAAEVADFVSILRGRSLAPLVCASGGGGSRHVWLRCDPIGAELVADMAADLAILYTSLDVTPLRNPRTGVLRAPGSTHRNGSRSTVIPGRRDTGVAAAVRAATVPVPTFVIEELAQDFAEKAAQVPAARPTPRPAPTSAANPVSSRAGGAAPDGSTPGIAWTRLPDWAQTLLDTAPTSDASERAFTLARSFVHAGWDRATFLTAAFTEEQPGLEHLRTRPVAGGRTPRHRARAHAIRQWDRANASVSRPAFLAGDPAHDPQIEQIVAAVVDLADQEVAGFAGQAGITSRRVLHALCLTVLTRRTLVTPFDVRTAAIQSGLPRQQVSAALNRLAEAGWIVRLKAHRGPLSAVWRLEDPRLSHNRDTKEPAPIATLDSLRQKNWAAVRDVWQLPGLGSLGLEVWWLLKTGVCTPPELAGHLGLDPRTIAARLARCVELGLARGAGSGSWRALPLQAAEEALGEHEAVGVLEGRRRAYLAESVRWTQLWAEVVWRSRRKGTTAAPLEVQLLRHHQPSDVPAPTPDPLRRQQHAAPPPTPSCERVQQVPLDQMLTWARSWRHRLARGEGLLAAEQRIVDTGVPVGQVNVAAAAAA